MSGREPMKMRISNKRLLELCEEPWLLKIGETGTALIPCCPRKWGGVGHLTQRATIHHYAV
jgi:hypothetical protein